MCFERQTKARREESDSSGEWSVIKNDYIISFMDLFMEPKQQKEAGLKTLMREGQEMNEEQEEEEGVE